MSCVFSIKKCCCLSLRSGCFIVAGADFVLNLIILIFVMDVHVTLLERGMTVCHCVGCFMLLLGALVRSTVLLAFYLITDVANTAVSTYSIAMSIKNYQPSSWSVLVTSTIVITTSSYSWLVVYSYFRMITAQSPPSI